MRDVTNPAGGCPLVPVIVFALLALGTFAPAAHAQETVVVDFSTVVGTAGDPVATGFRGTWWDSIPEALIADIRPSSVGAPAGLEGDGLEEGGVWARAADLGTIVEWTIFDGFGFHHSLNWNEASCAACEQEDLTPEECYDLRMQVWGDHVAEVIAHAEEDRVVGSTVVPLHYDIWNEPDGFDWDPAGCYGASDSLFFDMWKTAVDSIHAQGGLVAGPSFAGGVLGLDGEGASGIDLALLLEFWNDQDTWPDIFSWHHIARSDFRSNDDGDSTKLNLLDQVRYAKRRLAAAGADTAAMRYAISEMLGSDVNLAPGVLARNFALAERARAEGLLYVGRTYWCVEPVQPRGACDTTEANWCYGCTDSGAMGWPLQWTRLGGLVVPYGPELWWKRAAWWAYMTYADLEGTYVDLALTSVADGLASVDEESGVGRLLIGNYSAETAADLRVVFKNVPDSLVVNDAVRVRVDRLHGHPDSVFVGGVTPDTLFERNYLVLGDSVVVEVDAENFGPGDAINVQISTIEPDTTIAPG